LVPDRVMRLKGDIEGGDISGAVGDNEGFMGFAEERGWKSLRHQRSWQKCR